MRFKPLGSIAIVTGASGGIGRELALLLARGGATVVAVARREARLRAMADDVNGWRQEDSSGAMGCLFPLVGDVTDADTRSRAFAMADDCGDGSLDLLVNNAGIGAIGRFETADPDRMRQIMDVNFFAPVDWTRDAIGRMKRCVASGTNAPVICNIGSVLGHRGVPDKSEYCASKFAIHGFSDSLRAELVGDGIAVTLVSPSTTESEFFESLVGTDAGVQSQSIGQWSAAKVARATYSAIQSRRGEVILSIAGKALVYADRLSPPIVNAVLAKTTAKKHPPE